MLSRKEKPLTNLQLACLAWAAFSLVTGYYYGLYKIVSSD